MIAGVAIHLTLVGITEQLASSLEFWEEGRWAVENAAARICREAGGRVTTDVMIRDLDLVGPHVDDGPRVGCGRGRASSFWERSARSRHNCWSVPCGLTGWPGEGLRGRMEWPPKPARQRKVRTHPELVGPHR